MATLTSVGGLKSKNVFPRMGVELNSMSGGTKNESELFFCRGWGGGTLIVPFLFRASCFKDAAKT